MITEFLLNLVRFVIVGIITIFPTIPRIDLSFLDGVFMALSMVDLFINIGVVGVCLSVILVFMNIQLIWGIIMWVVRKIPGVN